MSTDIIPFPVSAAATASSTSPLDIVQIVNGEPMVSSLTMAKVFSRPHKEVMRSLRQLVEKEAVRATAQTYLDSQGKEQPMLGLNERNALIAMPYVGGENSLDGQTKLVDGFLHYRDHKPNSYSLEATKIPALPQLLHGITGAIVNLDEGQKELREGQKELSDEQKELKLDICELEEKQQQHKAELEEKIEAAVKIKRRERYMTIAVYYRAVHGIELSNGQKVKASKYAVRFSEELGLSVDRTHAPFSYSMIVLDLVSEEMNF
jgi:hypothetical protein